MLLTKPKKKMSTVASEHIPITYNRIFRGSLTNIRYREQLLIVTLHDGQAWKNAGEV